MKNIKKITAFVSALLITASCCNSEAFAETSPSDEMNSAQNIFMGEIKWYQLSDLNNVRIADKVYDGSNKAVIDFSPIGISSAEDYNIPGVDDGDDVQLTAEAFFDSADAGNNKTVTVKFGLKGNDVDKYELSGETYEIRKTASISKATVKIIPNSESDTIFCGEKVPASVPFSLSGDMASEVDKEAISILPDCAENCSAGKYTYSIKKNGRLSGNIDVAVDGSFYVDEKPEISLKSVSSSEENEITSYTVTVSAPKNKDGNFLYRIGKNENEMAESVDMDVAEGDNISFFIEHNNDNNRISSVNYDLNKSEYNVRSDSISIETSDGQKLNRVSEIVDGKDVYMLVTNKDLKVNVSVDGCGILQKNEAVLKNGEETYEASSVRSEFNSESGLYSYTYTFNINDVENGDEKKYNFDFEIKDEFDRTTSKALSFANNSGQAYTSNVVVDKKAPSIGNIEISYINSLIRYEKNNQNIESHGFFIADGNVTDSGSGIAKIEYKWDEDVEQSDFLEYGKGTSNTDHKGRYMLEAESCNKYLKDANFMSYSKGRNTSFQILVPYFESIHLPEPRWQHNLTLRLTDNAGNRVIISPNTYMDGKTFIDTKPPVVTSVEMSSDDGIRYLTSGNYSKSKITFSIVAKDDSESDKSSGITEYYLLSPIQSNDEEIIDINSDWNNRYKEITQYLSNEEEAVFSVKFNNMLFQDAFIAVFDQNRSGKYFLKNISGVKSNDILIDTIKPVISADISQGKSSGNRDDSLVWFKDGELVINADDTYASGDASGIYSISLSESESEENIVVNNETATDRKIKESYSLKMSGLEEGKHTYYYFAEDNAGNRSDVESVSFGYDKGAPSCRIEAVDPVYDSNWFKENDDFTVNIGLSDSLSGIDRETVVITVNGVKINFDEEHISGNDNTLSYILNKNDHLKDVPLNNEQCYHIEVKACDKAGNELTADKMAAFDVHIDRYSPWINDVTVSKTDTNASNKIINILNHGIFANTGITINVSVFDSDAEKRNKTNSNYNRNESQIKKVYVTFENGETVDLTPAEDNVNGGVYNAFFKIPLPEEGKAFKKRFKLTVCDNTGRECSTDYVISPSAKSPKVAKSLEIKENRVIDLVVEESAPSVSYSYPKPHYEETISENEKRSWFSEAVPAEISFSIKDEDSGLHDVIISENGKKLDTDDSEDKNAILSAEISENAAEIDCDDHIYKFITSATHGENDISGVHKYEVIAEDNAGNKNTPITYEYYIDNKKPSIKGASFPSLNADGKIASEAKEIDVSAESFTQEPSDEMSYSLFYQDAFTAKIFVDDETASSGLKELKYRLISNNPSDEEANSIIYTEKIISDEEGKKYATVNIPKGFKGRISVEAFDNVDNRSGVYTLSSAIVSENEKPDIDISISESSRRSAEGNALFTEDAAVRVVIKDLKSGLNSWKVNVKSEILGEDQTLITQVTEGKHNIGDEIGDGWQIEQMDANLITSVSKNFVFSSDDNDISLEIEANDNCGNSDSKESDKFTVDKTAPVIDIRVSEGINGTEYYNADKKAEVVVSVTERNFDPSLIKADINNSYGTSVPTISFTDDPENKSLHTAVLQFGEGDYSFDISGEDLAGFKATVNKPYDGVKRILVDETSPVITTNFDKFGKSGEELYFKEGKRAVISVIEHNFSPELAGLKVYRKSPGSSHDQNGFIDETYSFVSNSDWKKDPSNSDRYTLEFNIDKDSVYKIGIDPYDKAGNKPVFANSVSNTEVFEIDTVAPKVISKNGIRVEGKENELEFLDTYTPERASDEAPTVEFDDINFDHLSYTVKKYVPKSNQKNELGNIGMEEFSDNIKDRNFTLNDFKDDGIYYTEIYAFDKAGNKSLLNKNTYVRMFERDILAFIPNSSIETKSGLFSFEYENGSPISKRPDDFSDINITIMSGSQSDKKIVLRDLNGDETDTKLSPDSVNTDMFGVKILNYTLKSDFFKKNYQNDTDKELILSVKDNGERIDLGKIHIDNIKPEAKIPSDLKSWKWFPGKKTRNIVLSDISEVLDVDLCRIYDNNEEIPFDYSEKAKTLSFSINEGWHNIGIHLVDTAGNVFDMQEAENICVGHFWSWVIGGIAAIVAAAVGLVLFRKKKRKKNNLL